MMSGIVDIHSHILPGIDDGSASVQESIAMLLAVVTVLLYLLILLFAGNAFSSQFGGFCDDHRGNT